MPGQRTQYRRGQGNGAQLPLDFAYGHVQPQALEVEKAVLGALMIDRDAYMEVCEVLHIESFYEPRNQKEACGCADCDGATVKNGNT